VIRSSAVGWSLRSLYDWRRFYEEAVVETDLRRLPVLIRAAHAAIDARVEELKHHHKASPEERQALEDALAGLGVLRREAESNSIHPSGR